MLTHLQIHNIISPAQHGFLPRRSTQTQQIDFLNQLTSFHDQQIQAEVIYLDFSKAFDKVSHLNLLHVLNHINIHPKLINWIQNYLNGRTQVTVVESSHFHSTSVSSGVPQGSVLGPLLFIIYLQDLITSINTNCPNTTVYAFADDIKLVSSDANDLQYALNIVNDWTTTWKLLLNTDKSEHLTIRQSSPKTFYVKNQTIPKVNCARDLGVIVSETLNWDQYIEKVRSKANSLCHIILHTFSSNNIQLLTSLFKIYVRPILEYNTCTWSPHQDYNIKAAESTQKRFTKIICQRANISFSNYSDRLAKLNLESLKDRRSKNDLILAYKVINNLVDVNTKLFRFNTLGGYNLRRHNLQIEREKPPKFLTRNNYFSVRVAKHWNELPARIVESPTLAIFKNRLKEGFVNT